MLGIYLGHHFGTNPSIFQTVDAACGSEITTLAPSLTSSSLTPKNNPGACNDSSLQA